VPGKPRHPAANNGKGTVMSIIISFIVQFFVEGAVVLLKPQIVAAGIGAVLPALFVSQMIFAGLIVVVVKRHTEHCRAAAGVSIKEENTSAEMSRYVVVYLATMAIGTAWAAVKYPNSSLAGLAAIIVLASCVGGFIGLAIRKCESVIQDAAIVEFKSRAKEAKASGQTAEA